ncbi:hypothetical protein LCGC14_3023420, partial [marine sediment metagenome]
MPTDPTPDALAKAREGCPVCHGAGFVGPYPLENESARDCPECQRVARLIVEAK